MQRFFTCFISLLAGSITPAIIVAVYFFFIGLFTSSLGEIITEIPEMILLVSFVAGCHTFLLGLPLYLIVKLYYKFTYKTSLACGFLIGALPLAIYTWPIRHTDMKFSSSYNGVQHMIDGVPTMSGWLSYIQGATTFGFLGLSGALMFKYYLNKFENPSKSGKTDAVTGASS